MCDAIDTLGGFVQPSNTIAKSCNYLIVGWKTLKAKKEIEETKNYKKAQEIGVKIMNEDELLNMIR